MKHVDSRYEPHQNDYNRFRVDILLWMEFNQEEPPRSPTTGEFFMTRLSEPRGPRTVSYHSAPPGDSLRPEGEADPSSIASASSLVDPPIFAPALNEAVELRSPAPTYPDVPSAVVAARLRWFRTERGLRLEDVAKRAGYTKGFLSKIEHAKASPPVSTLLRVAAALGVDADVLFAPDAGVAPDASVHTRAGQGVTVRDDTAGLGRALLALAADRHHKLMEPFVVTLEPGDVATANRMTYPGEEFVYVLEGSVRYAVGNDIFELSQGDGLYFNATTPHAAVAQKASAKVVRVFCASPARRKRSGVED